MDRWNDPAYHRRGYGFGDMDPRSILDVKLLELISEIDTYLFQFNDSVPLGPFAGMKWQNKVAWEDGNNGLKLLGFYEQELHSTIEYAISRRPQVVVNIGCAEGYYACGFARRCPEATVLAVDTDKKSLDICIENAGRNGVKNRIITFDGLSSPDDLNVPHYPPETNFLYFVDCEGAEMDYLDPHKSRRLFQSDVIVECHDFLDKEITERLIWRFSSTHQIERIKPEWPDYNIELPFKASMIYKAILLTEKRPTECSWLAMWTKARA